MRSMLHFLLSKGASHRDGDFSVNLRTVRGRAADDSRDSRRYGARYGSATMNLDANLCLVAIISILYSICLDFTIFQGDTLTDLIHREQSGSIEVNVMLNLLLQELSE